MTKTQYKAIAYRFRECMAHITGIADFEPALRADARLLLALRDRCDMLEYRQWQFSVDGHRFGPSLSVSRRILTSTAPSRVLRRLAATYPTGLGESA